MTKKQRRSSRKRNDARTRRYRKQTPTPAIAFVVPNRAAKRFYLAWQRGIHGKSVRDAARKKRQLRLKTLRRGLRLIQRQMRRALRLESRK